MFPTFPSKAGQEKRRKGRETPQAPRYGEQAPRLDFAEVFGGGEAATGGGGEEAGAGFTLRLG